MILLALSEAVGGLIAFLLTWRARISEITLRLHHAQIVLAGENRLATLRRFPSVIAHEVGSPQASIMTRLELMERSDEERFLRDSLLIVRGQLGRIQKFLHGLGLTINRDLVRKHGSELHLVSRDGHGAFFQMRIPGAGSSVDTAPEREEA